MGKVNRIVFVGTYAKKTLHQQYDTGLLNAASLISNKVVCYKDKSTFDYINYTEKEWGYGNNIELRPIYVYAPSNPLLYIIGTFFSGILNIFLYFKTKRTDILIYAYNNFFSLHLINWLNRCFKKKIIVSCHGEMELLTNNKHGKISDIHRIVLQSFFQGNRVSKDIRFVLLGDSMINNIRPFVTEYNFHFFYSIECPCYMHDVKLIKPEKGKVPNIGVLGTLAPSRGLDDMIRFVKLLKESEYEFYFSVIGGVAFDNRKYTSLFETFNVNIVGGSLPRDKFELEISKLDYIVFFYPHDSYKLIASGTLLDAIAMNKPVIALGNDYFNYILNKTGHPSHLCENVDEMVEFFISHKAETLYERNFNAAKDFFSPAYISSQLQTIVDSFR